MNAVSFSEARKNLKSMIDKVVADRAPIAIITAGAAKARY
jgi:antitoxin YefM